MGVRIELAETPALDVLSGYHEKNDANVAKSYLYSMNVLPVCLRTEGAAVLEFIHVGGSVSASVTYEQFGKWDDFASEKVTEMTRTCLYKARPLLHLCKIKVDGDSTAVLWVL